MEQTPNYEDHELPMQSSPDNVGEERISAGSPESAPSNPSLTQTVLPGIAQELETMLRDLAAIPGQVLPAETVHHLKSAGREALLAAYSLWQNINRATKGAPDEKVRKHIEVE